MLEGLLNPRAPAALKGVRVVVQHDVHAHAHRCTQVADLMEALEYLDYRGKLSPSLFAKLSALLQVCVCALTCMHRACARGSDSGCM